MTLRFLAHCVLLVVPIIALAFPLGDTTQVVLLGTGTPNADPDRSGPGVAIVVNETPYLVDFGPGIIRRASAAFKRGVKGLDVRKLNKAFVTHLHSDHTAGYPDLILTPWVLERASPLQVFGPEGLEGMTRHVLAAYQQDIHMRIFGLEPANAEGYKVIAHEITPGVVYRDSNVTVEAFSVHHGSWPHAFGYKFTTADKVVVISGDAAPSEDLVRAAIDCDVLVHEVYSQEMFLKHPAVWQTYHSSFHTSTTELAAIAARVKPGLLVLYHQLYWGASDADLIKEIKKGYGGEVVSGSDLEVY